MKTINEHSLMNFDGFMTNMTEDAPAPAAAPPAAGLTTLGDVSGMGEPVLASRGVTGSGDVASPPAAKTKKKRKKVKSYVEFFKK